MGGGAPGVMLGDAARAWAGTNVEAEAAPVVRLELCGDAVSKGVVPDLFGAG